MPMYFDPNQMFNAFAQGSQVGGGIRKNQTQSKLAPMIAAGDYKGANAFAASRGDLEMMDYVRPMAEKADAEAYSKQLGGMLASGDTKGATARAFGAGKLDQGMAIQQYGRALRADEITDYKTGLEFLDSNADDVMKNFTPEQRKAEYIRRVAASPFGQDANIMTALERAGADGIITDEEVIGFRRELMTAGERMAQANADRSFEYGVGQDKQAQSNWERQFQADEAAREAAAAAPTATGTRLLTPQEVAAAGYPEGAVVQQDAKGNQQVRYKPMAEYSAGEIKGFRDKANVLTDFQRNLSAYESAVEDSGTISLYGPNNEKAANLDALHQALIFGAKDLLNLGILSKDDYENLNKLIPDATGQGTFGQGKKGFTAKLAPLKATIQSQIGMIPGDYLPRGRISPLADGDPATMSDDDLKAALGIP